MCGIIGYVGKKNATPILINGLLNLEYRGYDSAGISTLESTCISNIKTKGRVKNLYDKDIDSLEGTIGIAHTRWATHGKPSDENSHPHLDNSKTFSVVHNGIIENYKELKSFLEQNNYYFLSQTDTEVIPNLIHYYYTKNNNFLKSVNEACKCLKGSYAIEVLCKNDKDNIIVVRHDSPLVIGVNEDDKYVSSDIPAILSYSNNFYLLDNDEFAMISNSEINFYDINLNKIEKKLKHFDYDITSSQKNGYEDFMLKEIFEQPNSVRETIGSHLSPDSLISFNDFDFKLEDLKNINQIYIVACGTAMHAGLSCKNTFEKLLHIPVTVEIASEFRYRNPIIDNKTLAIYVSQSGETADTIAALKLAKTNGAKTIAITNVIGSSITREADFSLYTHAGPEIAVASTKAYTSQIVLLNILAIYFAETLDFADKNFLNSLKNEILLLPNKIEYVLKNPDNIKNIAKTVASKKDIFFLGRGIDYTVALEASLKLKEISYIHSEAYASGELKHGPIALIENGVTVVSILTDLELLEKSISNIEEVIARGASTFVITNQELVNSNYNYVINIPKTNKFLSPILSIIPLQLFAYYIAKEKNLDVDKPRNLAKSVTVE